MSDEKKNFTSMAEEMEYWKKEALLYKDRYYRIIKKRSRSLVDDEDEVDEKLAERKKIKVIKLYKDPVNDLPDVCHKILEHFNGKELLKLAEVSTSWKRAIDSCHVKRVLDNIKLKIVDGFTSKDFNILKLNNRPYKHLELVDCFEEDIFLTRRYSPILESLLIKDSYNFDRITMPACKFPRLTHLVLSHVDTSWFNWLESCNFLCVSELRYTHKFTDSNREIYNDWFDQMSDFLNHLSELKRLFIRTEVYDLSDIGYVDYQFELESGDFGNQFPKEFLDKQFETLKTLRVGCTAEDVYHILYNYENLDTLAIDIESMEDESDEEMDSDCGIQALMSKDEIEDLEIHQNITTLFIRSENDLLNRKIISSLVNLKTLVFYETLTKYDVEFLATTATALEKVICRGGIQNYVLDEYEELQQNVSINESMNTKFEILIEDTQKWDFDKCIWDDKALC